MSRLESRLGAISDTGQNFLESRLGGHGDVSPTPTPSDSPISRLDGDPEPKVPDPDLDDRSDVDGQPPTEDPLRPGPTPDGDSDSVDEPEVDPQGSSDREGVAPGEDPVQIEDHAKPEAKLNRDDYPNTQDYAGEAYNRINPYLRGEYDAPPFMGADDMIDGVKRELDSLPPTQEVSHRGMYMERSMVDRLFSGERFSDPAFLSTTKSPDVASNWIDELHDNRDPDAAPKDKVLVRVEGHTGRDISDISLNSGEKEILFKPGTEFDVVGRHWNDSAGRWEIELREVGHPDPGSHAGDRLDPPSVDSQHIDGRTDDGSTNTSDSADTVNDASAIESERSYTDHPTEWGSGQYDPLLDAHLPHLDAPESIGESVKHVNELGFWADPQRFGNNCHNVVEALELRARGYDVTAQPTVEGAQVNLGAAATPGAPSTFEGRHLPNIESGWHEADGTTRTFEYLSDHGTASPTQALEAYASDFPAGARGFITGQWQNEGTGHIFSFVKEADGSVRLIDGQTNTPDAGNHLNEMRFNQRHQNPWDDIRVLRVDDLEPTSDILQAARPNTPENHADTVSWAQAIRNGEPTQLPDSMVQNELDSNTRWRERNDSLYENLESASRDPEATATERNQASQMLRALREQNHRLEWGRYNFEMRIYEARLADINSSTRRT
nr:toxin glutamine deamidase domain-containing protein [Nocardioides albus]